MGNNKTWKARAGLCAAAMLCATGAHATPPCDDTSQAGGCITLQSGASGQFELFATFDVETGAASGSLHFVDAGSGLEVSSSTLIDYSYLDPNVRGFIFDAAGEGYNEARVFIADYGEAEDQFEIQLLEHGTIVYGEVGYLTAECAGGVVIVSNCDNTEPPPPPGDDDGGGGDDGGGDGEGEDGDHDCPPGKPDKDHPRPNRPKGNNGVGNGEDPQPPGNPPINDGPGTRPGSPGNRGGAHRR